MKTVLFIDDQLDSWLDILYERLNKWGWRVIGEENPRNALKRIDEADPDVVLLDIMFREGDELVNLGEPTLRRIRQKFPSLPVVMLTENLLDSDMGIDQEDYPAAYHLFAKAKLSKVSGSSNPFEELAGKLNKATKGAKDTRSLEERLGFIVGTSQKMQAVADEIIKVAKTDSKVLLTGETGTGKELVVRAIRQLGSRKNKPFVAVNCAGMTGDTLESRLFGHKKGAFTGAERETNGFFGEAEGGTLFLDEIEAMPQRLQELLLRVLDEKKMTKMGSSREQTVNVRLIAASNQNLPEKVKKGDFRMDLYQRLSKFEIALPPLRERMSDISALFSHIVQQINEDLELDILPTLREDVATLLRSYDWRMGNIRELKNAIHAAMVRTKADVLTRSTFDLTGRDSQPEAGLLSNNIVEDILQGKQDVLNDFKNDIKGKARRSILICLIDRIKERDGKRPTSSDLAKILNLSKENTRRIVNKEAGLKLKDWDS